MPAVRLLLRRVLPLTLPLLIAGCGAKNPLVGKWTGNVSARGMSVPVTMQFTDDGKETQSLQLMGQTMTSQGTYTAKDGTITQTLTSSTVNGRALPTPAGSAGRSQTAQYKVEGDTLTVTPTSGGPQVVLTRQKS